MLLVSTGRYKAEILIFSGISVVGRSIATFPSSTFFFFAKSALYGVYGVYGQFSHGVSLCCRIQSSFFVIFYLWSHLSLPVERGMLVQPNVATQFGNVAMRTRKVGSVETYYSKA